MSSLFEFNNRKVLHSGSISFEPGLNVLVGGNGSGKSSLLESLYLSHVDDYETKVVTFSSGQNQNFEENHLDFLLGKRKELNDGDEIFPHSFYFDIKWAPILLIFATYLKNTRVEELEGSRRYKPIGHCSKFLFDNNYCLDNLSFKMKVPQFYFDILNRNPSFAESDFVQIVDLLFDIDSVNELKGMRQKSIDFDRLNSNIPEMLATPVMSNELYFSVEKILDQVDESSKPEKIVKFLNFLQIASISDSYLDLSTIQSSVKRNDESFRFGDLSDGEYQLLCTYAILDIFNEFYDYIILDEVDSHIHFANLNPLWESLNSGSITKIVTSTHNPISLKYVSPERIKSLNKGDCEDGLSTLSRLQEIFDSYHTSKKTVALSFKNSETLILIDGLKDWKILCSLFKKIKGHDYNAIFEDLRPYPLSSKRNSVGDNPDEKDKFVNLLEQVYRDEIPSSQMQDVKLKRIICIKDRDNESLQDRYNSNGQMCLVKEEEEIELSQRKRIKVTKVFLHRREIENYLLNKNLLENIEDNVVGKSLIGEPVSRTELLSRIENEEAIATIDCKEFISSKICNLSEGEVKGFCDEKLNGLVDETPLEEISPYLGLLHDYLLRRL